MGEWRYSSTVLDLDTIWKWVVSFTPQSLYPRRNCPGTHWIGGYMGPRSGLTLWIRKKSLAPTGDRIPAVQPIARRYTDWALPYSDLRLYVDKINKHELDVLTVVDYEKYSWDANPWSPVEVHRATRYYIPRRYSSKVIMFTLWGGGGSKYKRRPWGSGSMRSQAP
jgi:hypothetical protein